MNRKKREQLILDAAVQVFARQGYPTTSVSEIIKEANVARGTFYLYFKSKKELFSALLDRFMMDIARDVTKINALNSMENIDLSQRFRMLASDFIATITRNRLLTKIILLDSHGLDQEFDAKLNFFYDQLSTIIRHNIDVNVSAGVFRGCQSDVVARCMIGSVKEIIAAWIANDSLELEPTIQSVIDYLLNGLTPFQLEQAKVAGSEEKKPVSRQDVNFH